MLEPILHGIVLVQAAVIDCWKRLKIFKHISSSWVKIWVRSFLGLPQVGEKQQTEKKKEGRKYVLTMASYTTTHGAHKVPRPKEEEIKSFV